MVYDLVPTAGYFIGVNPEMNCLALAASDFAGNLITEKQECLYVYENSPENLEEIAESSMSLSKAFLFQEKKYFKFAERG